MNMTQGIFEVINKFQEKFGHLPGYVIISDKDHEDSKESDDLIYPGWHKGGVIIKKDPGVSSGQAIALDQSIDTRTYNPVAGNINMPSFKDYLGTSND